MSFVREAWPFVLPPAIVGALLFFVDQTPWAWSALFLAFLILLFFRNPKRTFSGDADVVQQS